MSHHPLFGVLTPFAILVLSGSAAPAQPYAFVRFTDDERIGCGIGHDQVPLVLQDARGFLWCHNRTDLVRFDGLEARTYRHDPSDPATIGAAPINTIYEDSEGYIWLGYYQGMGGEPAIDRFDPVSETTEHVLIRSPGSRHLSHFDLTTLQEDRAGDMWFGTWGGGLGRVARDDGTVTFFEHDPRDPSSLSGDHFADDGTLFVDDAGTLWALPNDPFGHRVLNRFDPKRDAFVHYPDPAPAGGRTAPIQWTLLAQDGTGRLWAGTSGDGLYFLDRDRDVFVRRSADPSLPASLGCPPSSHRTLRPECNVGYLAGDRAGRLWFATGEGTLLRYDPTSGEVLRLTHDPSNPHSLPSDPIHGFWESREGMLWLRSGSSLFTSRPRPAWFEHIPFAEPPGPEVDIRALVEDRDGVVWAGGVGGLWKVRPTDQAVDFRPPVHSLLGLEETAGGDLLVAAYFILTYESFLWRYDRLRESFELLARWQDSTVVTSIAEDPAGTLWVGTRDSGLLRAKTEGGAFLRYSRLPVGAGSSMGSRAPARLIDRDGNLWTGTEQGLRRYEGNWANFIAEADNASFTRYSHEPEDSTSLAGNQVPALRFDGRGTLWVGTNQGLQRYDRTRDAFVTVAGSVGAVTAIADDAAGWIWLGTRLNGLVGVDPGSGTQTVYGVAEGLPSNRVCAVLVDDGGNVWAATTAGLSRLEPSTGRIRNFTSADGLLPGSHLSTHAVHCGAEKGANGTLYFGGVLGISVVHPGHMVENPIPPEVLLTSVHLRDEPMQVDRRGPLSSPLWHARQITLKHSQSDVTFYYVGLHFADPSRNTYAYKLEGLDEDWVQAGTQRSARYADLRPGSYLFRVKAANSDGVWNEEGASIGIVVRPPWWATWWAYLVYVFLIGGALVAGYRLRTRQLRRRAALLEHQVVERTHELAEQKQTVEEQAARLLQLEQAKDRFFANLSHEFRTPLTLILGPLHDLLTGRHGNIDPEVERPLQVIRRSGRRMQKLVDELLDLARLEVGHLELRRRKLDLVPFVGDLVRSFAALAEQKGITMSFSPVPERVEVAVDPDKVEQVVANLVSNALKFTGDRGRVGVSLTITDEEPRDVEIRVHDSGRGIPEEELSRIFDRFYQASNTGDTVDVGTGIGLALARELVHLHGGSIRAESQVGWGSTFIVRLPLVVEGADDLASVGEDQSGALPPRREAELESSFQETPGGDGAPASPAGVDPPPSPPLDATVLVVEDNDELRHYIAGHLKRLCRVVEASDGQRGLEKARSLHPDLILTDLMMPELDGMALLREVRSDPELAGTPVVILTARATGEAKIEGLKAGADDYLYKPFSAEELEARVENLVVIRRQMLQMARQTAWLDPEEPRVLSDDDQFLESVRCVVEKHLSEEHFTVDYLAAEVAMSARNLQRRLRSVIHLSPAGYVRLMRLKRAAQLLRSGKRSVARVAADVGYSDAAHFSKLFRQAFGIGPADFAKTAGRETEQVEEG